MLVNSGLSSQTNAATPSPAQDAQQTSKDAADWFLTFMRESPAQQMEDEWLKQHGLTRAQLDSMPTAQREAIIKQMQQDIKKKMEQELQNKTKSAVPISF